MTVTLDWGDGRTYSSPANAWGAVPASLADDYDLPGYLNAGGSRIYNLGATVAPAITTTNEHTITFRGTVGNVNDLDSQIKLVSASSDAINLSAFSAQSGLRIKNLELQALNGYGIHRCNYVYGLVLDSLNINAWIGVYAPTRAAITKNCIISGSSCATYFGATYTTVMFLNCVLKSSSNYAVSCAANGSSFYKATFMNSVVHGPTAFNYGDAIVGYNSVFIGDDYVYNHPHSTNDKLIHTAYNNILYSINNPTLVAAGQTYEQWAGQHYDVLTANRNQVINPLFTATGGILNYYTPQSGSPLLVGNQSFADNPLYTGNNLDKVSIGVYSDASEPDIPDPSDTLSTATTGGVQGTWTIAELVKYQKDETYGIDGTSVTGTYDPITGNYTDPGEAIVKYLSTYIFAGDTKTGSLRSTDPGESHVEKDITYYIESVLKTGTLLSTDPGVAYVYSAITYYINNVLKTGEYVPDFPARTDTLTRATVNNLAGLYTPCPVAGPNGVLYGANETEFTLAVSVDLPTQGTLTVLDNEDETATFTIAGTDTASTTKIYKRDAQQSAWDSTAIATITGNDSATVAISAGEYEIKAVISSIGGSQVLGATDPVPLHIQNPDKSIQYFDVKESLGMPGTGFKRLILETRNQPINPQTPGS